MLFAEVVRVLDALDAATVRHWVGGGWGVAVLVGRQTREHRDLDLAVNGCDLAACLDALGRLGYQTETDWLPVRVELAAVGVAWVDVHPVEFHARGVGRQAGLDGSNFDYPPDAFTVGVLNGRRIPCLSVRQQIDFHTGYQPRDQDRHDLAQLRALSR